MSTRFDRKTTPPLAGAVLLFALAALPGCKRHADAPATPASTTAPTAAVTPQASETPVATPSTGPAEGGTAIGGVVGNQDQSSGGKGGAPAPTAGDGAASSPSPPTR